MKGMDAALRRSVHLAIFLVLAGLGGAAAIDLTIIHVKVHTDPSYHAVCNLSAEVNCETVAQSPYAVFLGLPVAVWGLCGYLAMALLALHRPRARRSGLGWPGLLVLLTGVAAAAIVPLAAISKLAIHSVCLVCMASWAVTAVLLVLSLLAARREGGVAEAIRADLDELRRHKALAIAGALATVAVPGLLRLAVPRYWSQTERSRVERLPHGIDVQGLPWIGAADPGLVLVEFSDYQCPFCQRAERQTRSLIEENAAALRVVHRQFPLDASCNPLVTRTIHPRACALALAAICAIEQDRFWEMNDAIFSAENKASFDVEAAASRLGMGLDRFRECLASPEAAARLSRDVEAGREAGVSATPTFIVGGEALPGGLPFEEIRRLLAAAHGPAEAK